MTLQENILRRKGTIADRWYRRILETYPPQTARFLASEQNPFQNPIGGTVRPAVDQLVDLLGQGAADEPMGRPLDAIVRVRSVQGFTASDAVRFVLDLKQVVRQELAAEPELDLLAEPLKSELFALDERIDRLVLVAFDVYMRCREQLYALRAEEGRRRTAVLMRRFGMESEVPAPEDTAGPLV